MERTGIEPVTSGLQSLERPNTADAGATKQTRRRSDPTVVVADTTSMEAPAGRLTAPLPFPLGFFLQSLRARAVVGELVQVGERDLGGDVRVSRGTAVTTGLMAVPPVP